MQHQSDQPINLYKLYFSGKANTFSHFYDEITQLIGGQTHVVSHLSTGSTSSTGATMLDFFVNLNRAFADSLHSDARYPTEIPQFVHVKSLTSGSGSLSSGNFLIDSTLGRDTVFGIYVEDEEDHLIKSIQFR